MKAVKCKKFKNGVVYALQTDDGYPIETTDTFLPFYTKDAIGKKQNSLVSMDVGSRQERWMVGVSVMSGCPVRCKFCATGKLKKWRNLTSEEIVQQVEFIIENNNINPNDSMEFKINYTRMGEPFLNIKNVMEAIGEISRQYPKTHHYISTIGIKESDFSFIKDNITLQFSLHSFDDRYRNWLIPYKKKLSIQEIGVVRTKSHLKTTLNLTLVRKEDFDIVKLKQYFDKNFFFIKLSPINLNEISIKNQLGSGIINAVNLL